MRDDYWFNMISINAVFSLSTTIERKFIKHLLLNNFSELKYAANCFMPTGSQFPDLLGLRDKLGANQTENSEELKNRNINRMIKRNHS